MPTLSGSTKAPLYATFGTTRFGATRFGYHSARVFISIGGVSRDVLLGSLEITDELDEIPNRCHFRCTPGYVPTKGQEVLVTLGSTNNPQRIFGGHILRIDQALDFHLSTTFYDVEAIDYTWRLSEKLVTERYTNLSASAIVHDLIATYASGFTVDAVALGLATIDEITFTDEDLPGALTRLAKRIGGYWYVDDRQDVHFWVGVEAAVTNPVDLTSTHVSLGNLHYADGHDGLVTRVYVEGRGSSLLGTVLMGDTLIPLMSVDMFEASGEFAKLSFQGSSGGAQHLTFTGVVTGGSGTVVGPGLTPAAAPSGTRAAGAGVTAGTHQIAYGWRTAAGPTLPGPLLTIATGFVDPPPTSASVGGSLSGPLDLNAYYGMAFTFETAAGETTASPRIWGYTGLSGGFQWTDVDLGPTGTINRKIYRTEGQSSQANAMSAQLKLVGTFAGNASTLYNDFAVADGSLGANVPTSNTATAAQFDLAAIAVGPSGTTSRDVYMTAAGGAQLKLVLNLADNTTTTYTVTMADGALGADAPASDTSGLTQPDGQVNPGGTSLIVASAAAFQSGGGWALIGNGDQVIRYTGFTAGTLTGIPASGTGAITAAVAYNSTVTACPMLTGIPASGAGSITEALTAGDEVYFVVRRDDATAQATLLALVGGDGIREEWIQDRRLSIAEAAARGDAILLLRSTAEARLRYTSRDLNTRSGRTVTLNLASPSALSGSLKIQRVTISDFHGEETIYPTFAAEASSTRFTFEDLVRQVKGRS